MLVFVVAAGRADDDATRAMSHALRASLGPVATVHVEDAPRGDLEDAARARGEAEHASLVGIVRWSANAREASIRFVRAGDPQWSDRALQFDVGDAASERGRTVGFAIASIVPEEAVSPAPAAGPPEAPVLLANDQRRIERGVARSDHRIGASLDATVQAANAVGGYGGGVGGAFAARFALGGDFRLRVGLGVRAAEVRPAEASSRSAIASAGVAWSPWVDAKRRVCAGVRVDALLLGQQVVHLSKDDAGPDAKGRVLPGAGAALEGCLRFADQAALLTSLGAEAAFGRTDIFVHDRRVAALAPLRGVVELGVRISF